MMDKRKQSFWIKVFAALLAFSFILGMVVFTVDAFLFRAPATPTQNQSQLSEEEVQFDTNARMYSSIVQQNTTDTTAWISLGNTYYDWGVFLIQKKKNSMEALKKFAEAEKAYRRALELDPKNVNVLTDLGAILYYQGKLDEAKQMFDSALNLDPKNPAALFNAGLVARDLKDYEAASVYFEKFIAANPKDPNVASAKKLLEEVRKAQTETTGTTNK
jgi:cytochrome c-type biogenesis protein CcmH/NrfG